jgi:hypothetical protein
MKGPSMKYMVLVIVLLCSLQSAEAQVGVPNQDRPKELEQAVFGLGFATGYVSGFGLSFRHHLAAPFSYQLVGGIIKIDEKLYYNIGSELQYDLSRGETTRFYACGGMGYFYSGESGNNDLDGPFRAGLGIGVEKSRIEAFSFSADLMFSYFSDGTVLPLPQVGVHYYFY